MSNMSQQRARLEVSLSEADFRFAVDAFEGVTTPTCEVELRIKQQVPCARDQFNLTRMFAYAVML